MSNQENQDLQLSEPAADDKAFGSPPRTRPSRRSSPGIETLSDYTKAKAADTRVITDLKFRAETGHAPVRVKTLSISLDETSHATLHRIDEVLKWRSSLSDKVVLDRVEELFNSAFGGIVA